MTDANTSALNNWGKTLEEVIGKSTNDIFSFESNNHFKAIVNKIFSTGKPLCWETYFPPTDQHLSVDSIPLGDHFLSVGRDISEQKKLGWN